jgi:hypothetical protein
MFTKCVRFVAVLAVIASAIGNSGVAYAGRGALPSVSAQNIQPPRASQPQPLDLPALTITPANSLGVQFVHVATVANILSNATIIDHPLTNGKPNAILIVTPNYNPGGGVGTYDYPPISTYYDGVHWRIFNQDGVTPMPVGAAFNVIIPTAGAGVFVQTATALNSGGDSTTIDNALTNGHPNAMVLVTPRYHNSSGTCPCTLNNHPIGVWYSGSNWAIFNQDLATMPVDASFNVFVLPVYAGAFVHMVTPANNTGVSSYIDNALTNDNPNAIIFITPNYNPGGSGGKYNNHNIGVWYDGSHWIIFNQDSGAMTSGASFNVLVLVPASDIFVHTATAGNSASDFTRIDNALTNDHPNAIVFTTPNWNPGGASGMGNNHNIGVWYDNVFGSNQWGIYNQDLTAIPANAAFNVLVPHPDTSVFVHKATAANIIGGGTFIDYPLTNNHPNAILLVTPNWNPGGVGGQYDNHPIGVFYSIGKWWVLNQDVATMPTNATFNVFVPTPGPGVGVFVHNATAANISNHITFIDNPLTNGNPNAMVLVTPNRNPGGACPSPACQYVAHPIGVFYYGSPIYKWGIFNQDNAAMLDGAAFNVYVKANFKLYLPLILR